MQQKKLFVFLLAIVLVITLIIAVACNFDEQGIPGEKGEPGKPGQDGVGIKSVDITYQVGESGTVVPTGAWLSYVPEVPAGQYLWTRTVVTYTNDTTSTAYSVSSNGANYEKCEHSFGDWTDLISNCTVRWQVRICSKCDETQLQSGQPIGHNFIDGVCAACGEVDPTYEEPPKAQITVYFYDDTQLLGTDTAYAGSEYVASYVPNITGYTFKGWRESNGKTFTSATLWEDMALYVVKTRNSYLANLDVNGGDSLEESSVNVSYGLPFSLPVPTRTGYSFDGWYVGDVRITYNNGVSNSVWGYTDTMTVIAHWQIKNYQLILSRNDTSAGTVAGSGTYTYDRNVTITATTNIGYTWVGWFDGDEMISDQQSLTFAMPASDVAYTARWCKVTLERSAWGGEMPKLNETYKTGDEVTVAVTSTFLGYVWKGWFDGEQKLTDEMEYTFAMPTESMTLTATWELMPELAIFSVISTETTCVVSLRDKTLTEVVIPDFVTGIDSTGFMRSSITSITIPDGVTSIGNLAFMQCQNLESITIPNSVTDLGRYAFYGCSNLTSVTLGSGVTSIDGAFRGCSKLESVTMLGDVTSIGAYSFFNCSSLKSITIPASVTSISFRAFFGCTALTSVTFENSNGWWCEGTTSVANGTEYFGDELSDPTIAAEYLTSAYVDYYWYRSESN